MTSVARGILFAGLVLAASAGAQGIQRWRTPDGAFHFGENPPVGSVRVDSSETWRGSSQRAPAREAVRARASAGVTSDESAASRPRRRAADACQKEIRGRARDPREVSISGLSVSETAPATFTVSGTQTASNAFGKRVRSSFTCQATVMGFDRWIVSLALRDAEGIEVALGDEPAPPGPVASREPVRRDEPAGSPFGSDAPWYDAPASSTYEPDVAAISVAPPPPRLSPSGRAVEFSGTPEIHWGKDSRKTIDFCVENFTHDWRKVTIRIGEEQHQIGFVGPRQTECDELDTAGLASGNVDDLAIDERVASQDELQAFGVGR